MSDHKRKAPAASQPITRHPLFPAIVALWVGAAFALASLAMPVSLIEGVIQVLRIDRIVSMAAPPLGSTARVLIALAATGAGGVAGWIAALRLTRPAAPVATPAKPAARKPEATVRRRNLALEPREPEKPAVERPGILNLSELDLTDFAPIEEAQSPVEPEADHPTPRTNALFDAYSRDACSPDIARSDEPGEPEALDAPEAAEAPPCAAERIASAALSDLSPVELLERLALAMASRRERVRAAVQREPDVLPEAPAEEPPQPAAEDEALPARLPPAPLPAALRPIDTEADSDDALPGYIPPRSIALTAPSEEEQSGYSSLLDLSRPGGVRAKPAKESPQSVVVFPGEEARQFERPGTPAQIDGDAQPRHFDTPGQDDPEEAERALRKALETLQRMSGAA